MQTKAIKTLRCLYVGADRAMVAGLTRRVATEHDIEIVAVTSRIAATALLEQTEIAMVIADAELPGGGGLSLLKLARRDEARECFLAGRRIPRTQLIEAMQAGIRDVFETPLDTKIVSERLAQAAERMGRRRHVCRRNARLRELSTRIIRDRREIRRRVDVVCRDLVGAYRQLAEKVVSLDSTAGDN